MQDYEYDEYDPVDEGRSRFSRIKSAVSTAVGALVAMALLLTLGIWFYRLGVRDAQNVPIIRAAVEPAKTRPDDPGGLVAPHQDVSSYDVADSQGVQASAAVIAPPPPEPKEEDVAMGQLAAEEAPLAPVRPVSQSGAQVASLNTVSTDELLKQAEKLAAEARVSSGTAAGADPANIAGVVTDATDPAGQAGTADGERLALAPTDPDTQSDLNESILPAATDPESGAALATPENEPEEDEKSFPNAGPQAPAISPMTRSRPTDLKSRVAQAAKVEEASAENLAVAAAQSKIQIQLAADPSETVVLSMWQRIQRANSDILHDRALTLQTTNSGGTTYYRLRVGPFKDGAEARSVCQALRARGLDCIVARNS